MEKGGLAAALADAGITVRDAVGWADEMRVGLLGTTRRVWGRRGVKVRQRLQMVREWRYLNLVIDPTEGRLSLCWSRTMTTPVARTLVEATRTETDVAALVWDRAPSHRDATVHAVGLPLIEQPPYAPEPGTLWVPVERVFEYLRAGIEGIIYEHIDDKVAAVEAILVELDADPERVKRLTGWHWIVDTLHQLPQSRAA